VKLTIPKNTWGGVHVASHPRTKELGYTFQRSFRSISLASALQYSTRKKSFTTMAPKVVLITGASGGIGLAIAVLLAKHSDKYKVIATARTPSAIQDVASGERLKKWP
jgi:FlaA1/EpsC-like NDP-sugar epimerase